MTHFMTRFAYKKYPPDHMKADIFENAGTSSSPKYLMKIL